MAETHTASLTGGDRPTARPRPARLRVIYPRELAWTHELTGEPVTLGRQPDDGSPVLPHATVSRRHAQVWWDVQGHHAVRDAGSRHGTVLGTAVLGEQPRVLADGDVLRLGDVLLVYESAPDADGAGVDRDTLPGASPAMVALRARVARAAADPSPALISGDTGTGKEWVARELHRLSRRGGPLVAVNCATLTRELVESQLFGHVRGAFTGATSDSEGLFRQADGGTLFLDEIGELPLELQPKLLRVVQDGVLQPVGASKTTSVDVRLVAATNRDLGAAVEAGGFRRDLLARLGKWELRLPRLVERRGDLLEWIDRLWQLWHVQRDQAAPVLGFTPGAASALLAAPWADNLRGVDRLVHELAGARAGGAERTIDAVDLPGWLKPPAGNPAAGALGLTMLSAPPRPTVPGHPVAIAAAGSGVTARPPVPTRDEFVEVWGRLGGSVRAVARHFGRDRRQIYRWLETHGIRVPEGDDPGE
jgi:DNA-binding NtrC family response regulator